MLLPELLAKSKNLVIRSLEQKSGERHPHTIMQNIAIG
jgi:hypothetical protein